MQALLSAKLPCRIAAVISNRADAQGLEIARQHGIATRWWNTATTQIALHSIRHLAEVIDSYQPDFVVLAGFMRILTTEFVEHYVAA